MAEAFREITEWPDSTTPNHQYLMEGDKVIAYIKATGGDAFYFSKPLVIDKRRRKFAKMDTNPFTVVVKDPDVVEVAGSKGAVYFVNKVEKTCTCAGFTFRGKCKHLEMA